jgi:dihydrofolate reductase
MQIAAVVAMSENRVIGRQNKLPWHLPADLHHFKTITMGKPILMGRKTYESIGRPLPGRRNIIITRDPAFQAPGCVIVNSIESAVTAAVDCDMEIFIIGGALLYEQFLPRIQRIYMTVIHAEIEGDAFFPELNEQEWQETERTSYSADEKNNFAYSFVTLVRR